MKLKNSYDVEDIEFNQVDFPVKYLLFVFPQVKVVECYKDKDEFKKMKIRFHVVLRKSEEEAWSLVKISKLVLITLDALYEGVLQNF